MKDTPIVKALVPATNALFLIAFAREKGLDPRPMLAQLGIQEASLSDEAHTLSAEQCTRLMGWVSEAADVPSLGYELGLRVPSTAHGMFSLGVLSCATPQQALDLATQFFALRNPTFGLSWSIVNARLQICLTDLMPHMPMRQTATEWVLLSVLKMGEALMGASRQQDIRSACELHMRWSMPSYHHAYADRLPTCQFNATETGVLVPAHWLTASLDNAAPGSLQLARQACERDQAMRAQGDKREFLQVQALLEAGLHRGSYPTREELAHALHMSVSTLQRLLSRQGCSYSTLLNQVRLQHAQHLLGQQGLTVEAVSARLGYDNTANFTRGFKQWSGMTPSAWRDSQRD